MADPHLGGGQVAVLRLHAASAGHATDASYSCLMRVYVRYGTKVRLITKEAPNFSELRQDEVQRISLPRTSVNKKSLGDFGPYRRGFDALLIAE